MNIKKISILLLLLAWTAISVISQSSVGKGLLQNETNASDVDDNPEIPNEKRIGDYLCINFLIQINELDQANSEINGYLKTYPDDPFILTEKAILEQDKSNDTQKISNLLNKSRALYPEYYFSNYLTAALLFSEYTEKEDKTKLEEALRHLRISLKDEPEYYDSVFLMGVILYEKGEHAESNRYLEQAYTLSQAIEPLTYMVLNYKQLKDANGEISTYERMLDTNPGDTQALNELAEIYIENEDYKKALEYLETLFYLNPSDQKNTFRYLTALFGNDEADKFLEVSAHMDLTTSPVLAYCKALILCRKNKNNEAEQLLAKTKNKDSNAYLLLSQIYLQKKDYYGAFLSLENAEPDNNPDNEKMNLLYYSLRFHLFSALELNHRAVELFNKLSSDKTSHILEQIDADQFYEILSSYSRLGLAKEALEATTSMVNILKEKSGTLPLLIPMLQAFLEGKNIDVDEVYKTFKEKKLTPSDANTKGNKPDPNLNLYLIATFYKTLKQYDKAIAIITKIKETPPSPYPSMELSDIYFTQGNLKKMHEILKNSLAEYPTSKIVKNQYAYYLSVINKDLHKALKLSADALADDKTNPAYLDTYGYILFRMGKLKEAGEYLEKAYLKLPFSDEVIDHIVDYYRATNQTSRIREVYQKALENDVDFKDQIKTKIEELNKLSNVTDKPNTPEKKLQK